MNEDNHLNRLLALLALTFLICCLFYFLPNHIGSIKLKRVDLLADLRTSPLPFQSDSLMLADEDTLGVDSVKLQELAVEKAGMDSVALAKRDSLYRALYAVEGADSLGLRIEDYSIGHTGLSHFFQTLRSRDSLRRPVRIGFLGDSFIEGDILVADLRAELQREFGGKGVGLVPISSVAARFRPTAKVTSEGWKTWSMLNDHSQRYTLACMLFEAELPNVSLQIEAGDKYPEFQKGTSLKFIYEVSHGARLALSCNDEDSTYIMLPETDSLTQYVYDSSADIWKAAFHFSQAKGLKALGVALEDENGIVVDNFSVRGNSGLVLERLDSVRCRQLNRIRPYDMIIMQYGLNVANDSVMLYGWYDKRMEAVVHHIKHCFPTADILILGVSDRSKQENGEFYTMPSVLSLLHAQRQMAKRCGLPFWNTFGAMGGENSMVEYVKRNWASKDYTHLGFGGGRELARILKEALMAEKNFYDEAETEE